MTHTVLRRCRRWRRRGRRRRPVGLGLLGPGLGLELLDDGGEGVGDDEDHDQEADQQDDHCGEGSKTCLSLSTCPRVIRMITAERKSRLNP